MDGFGPLLDILYHFSMPVVETPANVHQAIALVLMYLENHTDRLQTFDDPSDLTEVVQFLVNYFRKDYHSVLGLWPLMTAIHPGHLAEVSGLCIAGILQQSTNADALQHERHAVHCVCMIQFLHNWIKSLGDSVRGEWRDVQTRDIFNFEKVSLVPMYENEMAQLFVVARVQNLAETETLFTQATIRMVACLQPHTQSGTGAGRLLAGPSHGRHAHLDERALTKKRSRMSDSLSVNIGVWLGVMTGMVTGLGAAFAMWREWQTYRQNQITRLSNAAITAVRRTEANVVRPLLAERMSETIEKFITLHKQEDSVRFRVLLFSELYRHMRLTEDEKQVARATAVNHLIEILRGMPSPPLRIVTEDQLNKQIRNIQEQIENAYSSRPRPTIDLLQHLGTFVGTVACA